MYSFLRWCPGALGIFLRQKIYPRFFLQCGKNVLFGRFIHFKNPKKICIGNNVVLGEYVILDATLSQPDDCVITIEDGVFIGMGTILELSSAPITIKEDTSISSQCSIRSSLPVTIGCKVLIAAYTAIGTIANGTNHTNTTHKSTEINAGCWLGARVKVNNGVHIGEGSIVGAHGRVETDLPANIIAVGEPAKIVSSKFSS